MMLFFCKWNPCNLISSNLVVGFPLKINSFCTLLALESTQWPEGGQDGQVLVISGPQVVGDGWD